VLVRPSAKVQVFVNLMVMEKNYNHKARKETVDHNDGCVCFRNSELILGQLGKATLGNGNKDGLFTVLLRDYNSEAAAVCMNRLAKLSARWIGNHGFSIGIDDVQPGAKLSQEKLSISYHKVVSRM
jgi:DNA-directed RNA polymerase III subunit RPC1